MLRILDRWLGHAGKWMSNDKMPNVNIVRVCLQSMTHLVQVYGQTYGRAWHAK